MTPSHGLAEIACNVQNMHAARSQYTKAFLKMDSVSLSRMHSTGASKALNELPAGVSNCTKVRKLQALVTSGTCGGPKRSKKRLTVDSSEHMRFRYNLHPDFNASTTPRQEGGQ